MKRLRHLYLMIERKRNKLILIASHIAIWLLILQLQYDLLGLVESFIITFIEGEKYLDEAFVIIPSLIGLFYWNSNFLIPRWLNRNDWWKYLLSLILSFLAFFFVGSCLFTVFEEMGYDSNLDSFGFFDHSLTLHFIIVGISTSLGVSKLALKNAAQKTEAVEKQKEAELKYLIAQVNPHFLFNTLNGIYSLAFQEDAPKTSEAILKLSEIMRYPLKEGNKESVPLSREIQFIESYIDLQKIRLGKTFPISFEVTGAIANQKIAPLLFIPFVENAFKYGVSRANPLPIKIKINVNNDTLIFECQNHSIKQDHIPSHELGINNVKSRLDILYKEKYSLKHGVKDGKYIILLTLEKI